jgi:ATP-dependent RNA helicase DeaD
VRHLYSKLTNRGFNAVALSGEHSQSERNQALQALRDRRARVCVATDVAARGIDLPNVSLVVHVELPRDAEGLKHRSGRTGRAGKKGTAVLVVPYQRRKRVESMLRGAKIEAEWIEAPTADDIRVKDRERLIKALSAPVEVDEEDRTLGARLLETLSAEDVAAAFVRAHRAKLPAPEELLGTGSAERLKDNHRAGFDNSVWFRINVGRRNNADPKWILPLLCRRGGVTKNDIGAIRITAEATYVGVAAAAARHFAKEVAKPGHHEDHDVEIVESEAPAADAGREKRSKRKDASNASRPRMVPKPFGSPRGDRPGGGKRPSRKHGPAKSKHGVKHKAKGNRPR